MKIRFRLRLAAALLLALPSSAAFSQNPAAPPSPLPVREVVLFTSGVSYIERGGAVDGSAAVPLQFRTAQINDILKSMVLLDEKGQVQPVTYGAREPIGRTLQSFAVDVTQPLGRAELLNRLRGARVTVEATGRETLTGQIVGVEQRQEKIKDGESVTTEILTVLGERGLQSVRLDEVRAIRLLDARLDREFREALGILASGSDDQRRQVMLRFDGAGRRQVRVGYVMEAPLWKMSYRLLLGGTNGAANSGKPDGPAAKPDRPYIQGWALVENTTDDDWQRVRLSLVSGRPVSFIQDLYQPLYLPRPVVPPDVVASPYPQTHGGNLDEEIRDAPARVQQERAKGARDGTQPDTAEVARPQSAPAAAAGSAGSEGIAAGSGGGAALNRFQSSGLVRGSVAAQAEGQSAGELFQYNITTPVTLPRQQAAMIPVIAQDIDGEKVSLYNADTGPRFPLNAVRVKNTTTLHLKGGPVTLFDDGVYAGDARMEDIPPGDSRLVSYAVDLSVEGERQGPAASTTETSLSLRRGVLTVSRRERLETTYTLKSRADKARTVLVEHPFRSEYKLVAPAAAAERAANYYRFAVAVPPGTSQTLKVAVERPLSQTIAILDGDLNALAFFANRKDIAPRLREALQEVVQRRRRVQEREQLAASREGEIEAIGKDQDRIRKNMVALDKASALYKRYVGELDRQETRIQNLRQEAGRLRKEAAEADRDLRAYVDNLSISE